MLTRSARASRPAAASSSSSVLAAAIGLALASAAANAQTTAQNTQTKPQALPKVSVQAEAEEGYKTEAASSPKFTRPLIDTPQTVTVVRKEIIAEQGAASLSDTMRNIPGITFQLGENGNTQSGDTVFMRGFDTQNSIFLDGIRDLGASVRDVFNVEQIEIFKGPAGADNGRGATSGYVNLASKLPGMEDAMDSTVAYGSNERRRASLDVNQAFGSTAVRLNVVGQDGGIAGRNTVERQLWGVAPSIAMGLGTDTRFYAFSQHVRQNNLPDGAVNALAVADQVVPFLQTSGVTPQPVDQENFYGLNSDFEDIKADMFTARFEHDFSSGLTLRNTSRYGKSDQERILTAPNGAAIVSDDPDGTGPLLPVLRTNPATWTVARSRHASYRENKILTNQTNLTSDFTTGSFRHTLSGGLEFIYEKQLTPTYVSASLGTAPPANLYNPNPADAFTTAPAPTTNGGYTDGNTMTTGAYLFDTIDVARNWQLTAGLRVEQFDTEFHSVTAAGTPIVITPQTLEISDTLTSWKVGLLYKPAENGSVYVAYANSLKPPGGDNFTLSTATTGNNALNNPQLDPQESSNIELGTKWDLMDGRVAATAALFHSENKNDVVSVDPADPNVLIQLGERQVEGVELGLVGRVTDAWQISAGLTRQDTEVTEGTATQTGSLINFSPKLSATLWTTYRLPMGLTVGGGARHVDTQTRQINNAPTAGGIFEVPSYTVLDAFASYSFTERLGAQLNVYNLTDEFYVGSVNNSGQRYMPGTPRSFLVTFTAKF